ncbi:unnamed protein product [Echinostoma caproni]|uniref:MSP domain-containing protein n=1 Tax=Echinostoma caproni TaxID=27848 RepID=A0A183AI46_9TREM|nr:unnamed protein product [Echinostoma caproni]
MSDTKQQILIVEPKNELNTEVRLNIIITSMINLSNQLDTLVCLEMKTTVPKRYCVRLSSGMVKPIETRSVTVMLQPFSEKTKHKFMIQSMIFPEDCDNFENADPVKIMNLKLLKMAGGLIVIPRHELLFEGPFTQTVQSTVTLKNPSTVIYFKLQASFTRFFASPTTGVIEPDGKTRVTVVV